MSISFDYLGTKFTVLTGMGDDGMQIVFLADTGEKRVALLPVPDWNEGEDRYTCTAGINRVIDASNDILAEELLAGEGDPSYDEVAEMLPQQVSYDFIGTENSKWKYLVYQNGNICIRLHHMQFSNSEISDVYYAFNPESEGFAYAAFASRQGLLDGYLPVSCIAFNDRESKRIWWQLSFARTDITGRTRIHICLINGVESSVFLRVNTPDCSTAHELRALKYEAAERQVNGSEFYRELFALIEECDAALNEGGAYVIPDQRLVNAQRVGMIKSWNTYTGDAPRYGATRYFCEIGIGHESFAPTTTTMVTACLEWGYFIRAKKYLRYFLNRYVDENGNLIHRCRGATVSEAGMLLDTIARYFNYTGDKCFLDAVIIAGRITRSLLEMLRDSDNDLIAGCPEDDCRHWRHNKWYSINCWLCRGLMEAEKMFRFLVRHGVLDEADIAFVNAIPASCRQLRDRILASIRESAIDCADLKYIPPYPGHAAPFENLAARNIHYDGCEHGLSFPGYVNYRVYLEMLSADILPAETCDHLIRYREHRGGEILGMTRLWDDLIDDWPLYNYLWALLAGDKVRKFLMVCYAHMAHHQARGTFFAPESAHLSRLRRLHCLPCQLIIPLALRWMLLFEERDDDVLWICKATPRSWLADGEQISVTDMPTRWGAVSFDIKSNTAANRIIISVIFAKKPPERVYVRLRLPRGKMIADVVSDDPELRFEVNRFQELICIFPQNNRMISMVVGSRQRGE